MAIAVLTGITIFAVVRRRSQPYLAVGWLWYLGTLLPVIGLIQVGPQARADRFTYVPHIGLLLMLVWGVSELMRRVPKPRVILAPLATAAFAACTLISVRQVGMWHDSITLWERTLDLTGNNGVAHYNLGVALVSRGDTTRAIEHFQESVRLEPDFAHAHNRLALALDGRGESAEVTKHLAEVTRIRPNDAEAFANLGVALVKQGRTAEAIEAFSQAVILNPADATSRSRIEYLRRGKPPESPPDTSRPERTSR
jgi:tetratricopeptide (TPR) repeat protein